MHRPENRGHVVPELGDWKSSEAIDATCYTLDVALLSELDKTDLVQTGGPRLRRSEVAALAFGDSVQDGVPLALVHDSLLDGNNITSLSINDS
jgi:hypothetical protein